MKKTVFKCWKVGALLFLMLMVFSFLYPSFLFAGEHHSQYSSVGLVNELEAVAIADLWMRMELNSGYMKMEESECRTVHCIHLDKAFAIMEEIDAGLKEESWLRVTPPHISPSI